MESTTRGGALLIEAPDRLDSAGLEDLRRLEKQTLLASSTEASTKGALIVGEYKGTPFYEVKWRDFTGTQRKRRLGRAWVERDADGDWTRRRGRVRQGFFDARRAYALIPKVIEAHEEELRKKLPGLRQVIFEDAVEAWLAYLQTEKRIKPSTLAGYRSFLAQPIVDGRKRKARIMRAFGGRSLFEITTSDIRRFLAGLDREGISARTVNMHRQILHALFEFARRKDSFGLPTNPVAGTAKRPEDGPLVIETFEPDEIRAIAEAAREGLHRKKSGYEHSEYSLDTEREWERVNEQDAALFVVAAFTGLRLGELLALRWRDVDLKDGVMVVSRAMSAGKETSTKSRRVRTVPLAQQAREELERLRERDHFTARDEFVFCRADGGPLDRSAVRRRFIRAQKMAGIRRRRFHDLRHTFGTLAVRRFDLVTVKEMMGHAKLATTERYLHARPRPTDAATLTAIFAEHEEDEPLPLAA